MKNMAKKIYINSPKAMISLWLVVSFFAFSNAAQSFASAMVAFGLVLLMGLYWLARLAAYIYLNRKGRGGFLRSPYVYFGLEPAAIILSAVIIFSGALPYVRFFLSLPFLEHHANEVNAGHIHTSEWGKAKPKMVGLYIASGQTDSLSDGSARFITSGKGIFDSAGFIRSNTSPPLRTQMSEDSYKHIYGKWWFWYASW